MMESIFKLLVQVSKDSFPPCIIGYKIQISIKYFWYVTSK